MLISRCGWHRRYFGRPKWKGIKAWWPLLPVNFSDGFCARCEARFHQEFLARHAPCLWCGAMLSFTEAGWIHVETGRTIATRVDGRDDHVALPTLSA